MFREFPAPAGINRRAAERFPRRTGVPRASGDKPAAAWQNKYRDTISPRQRG